MYLGARGPDQDEEVGASDRGQSGGFSRHQRAHPHTKASAGIGIKKF
jgi:hypothetical protein